MKTVRRRVTLLSATYDWIGLDQIDDPGITHKDFLDLLGRLRGDTPYRVEEGEEDARLCRVTGLGGL